LAEAIGATNTLARRDDGSLYACNTDYAAALDAVCDALGVERDALASKRVAVLGAGGAASAIVAGFAHYGADVVVYNRTLEKAQALADRFAGQSGQVAAAPLASLPEAFADVFVNCTPMGMHPNTDESLLGEEDAIPPGWGPNALVFDTIYNPPTTKLLRQAEQAGCRTLSGAEMFIRQAAAQFELWMATHAPLETFRRVIRAS